MQCDLCGGSLDESRAAVVSPFRMRTAVRRGFDPFRVPGIDTAHARRIASVLKLDARTMLHYWAGLVRAQRRRWVLCPKCAASFAECTRFMPQPTSHRTTWEKYFEPLLRRFRKERSHDLSLFDSAATGNLPLVVGLLMRGIHPDAADVGKTPALFMASVNGHNDVVKVLIAAGAKVNAGSRTGGATALMFAALRGRGEVVLTLLQAGANPNAQSEDGETAIMFAVKGLNPLSEPHARLQRLIITSLMMFGADPRKKNNSGETALDDVRLIMDQETKRLLERAAH
jgi:ankyrin repeat protein